ncbi:MAG: hypothetical protein VB858_03860 [Planctomycetaceae bacterium]
MRLFTAILLVSGLFYLTDLSQTTVPVSATEIPTVSNQAVSTEAAQIARVRGWLQQYQNSQAGTLPDTFSVRIQFDGYLDRQTGNGTQFYRPREIYEFTPTEVRRLCIRAVSVEQDGATRYRLDQKNGSLAYEVAARQQFSKIDQVCRILLALDYLEMVNSTDNATGRNLHYLQVMTDSGLRPLGDANIEVNTTDIDLLYGESCTGITAATSAQSIRFSALYHTLRRLARSELGLSAGDWDDALDIIAVDGAVRPAAGTFRARN